jgi:hypothetical protein
MKRLGPDLKMPDLKTPDFLVDLLYDLRDRRLLAPIALVVVAIIAVPFLLSGGSDGSSPPPVAGVATAPAEAEAAKAATLTVVEAKPGLRDYRKRLAARRPTDPFKQRYTAPKTAGAELNQSEDSSSIATTVTTSSSSLNTTASNETTAATGSPTYTPPPSPSPSPGGTEGGKPHLTFFTWAIDVRISKAGGEDAIPNEEQEPSIKHKVLPQTSLPGPKAPVVTYMGLSRKAAQKHHAARALMLVSDKVTSVSSEARCVSGGDGQSCQLIEVEPGLPVTFVYGSNETRYTIKLLKTELVVTGHS